MGRLNIGFRTCALWDGKEVSLLLVKKYFYHELVMWERSFRIINKDLTIKFTLISNPKN